MQTISERIRSVYEGEQSGRQRAGYRLLVNMSDEWLRTGRPALDDDDAVGQLASLINVYFERAKKDILPHCGLFELYVQSFASFIQRKRVLDRQQWTAFYHAASIPSMKLSLSVINKVCDAIESLPHRPYFFQPNSVAHVQALKLMARYPNFMCSLWVNL